MFMYNLQGELRKIVGNHSQICVHLLWNNVEVFCFIPWSIPSNLDSNQLQSICYYQCGCRVTPQKNSRQQNKQNKNKSSHDLVALTMYQTITLIMNGRDKLPLLLAMSGVDKYTIIMYSKHQMSKSTKIWGQRSLLAFSNRSSRHRTLSNIKPLLI